MNRGVAFRFIPELVHDLAHVSELSRNPTLMYLESAMSTIHMAASVFETVEERKNTIRKKETEHAFLEEYVRLTDIKVKDFRNEELRRLDVAFEEVKTKVKDGLFRDEIVRGFVPLLQARLSKVLDAFRDVNLDSNYAEQSRIDELTRKALRDYKNLVSIQVENGNANDKEKDNAQWEE